MRWEPHLCCFTVSGVKHHHGSTTVFLKQPQQKRPQGSITTSWCQEASTLLMLTVTDPTWFCSWQQMKTFLTVVVQAVAIQWNRMQLDCVLKMKTHPKEKTLRPGQTRKSERAPSSDHLSGRKPLNFLFNNSIWYARRQIQYWWSTCNLRALNDI